MTYGPDELSSDMTQIRKKAASFEVRARLEHFLLTVLKEHGNDAVADLLQSLPGHHFRRQDDGASEQDASYLSSGHDAADILVATFLSPDLASVNVTTADSPSDQSEPDPRHRAFYDVWENLLGISDSAVAQLDPKGKAVFLVGLLEAEVMNGGLGQYLTNTDGVYLEETIQCLASIGAERTRGIVVEAGRLGAEAESYVAAWESKSEEFQRLDEEFLESGEDLAGLTADAFLQN
jgi:hypothetical protein